MIFVAAKERGQVVVTTNFQPENRKEKRKKMMIDPTYYKEKPIVGYLHHFVGTPIG